MFDFTRNQIGLKQSAEHSDLLIQQVVLDMAEERATPYFCLNGQYITQIEVLQHLENGDNDVKKQLHVSLPSPGNIENAEIVTLIDDTTHKSLVAASHNPYSKIIVSMSRNGGLFANERCLARDCTSVLTTAAHIIFTTSKHLLKFIHLVDVEGRTRPLAFGKLLNLIELEVPLDTPEIDERCRVIERGARLVTVIPSTSALVLQMPRGNLETIYPRALVLAGIRISIAHRRYKAAFMSCRSHRVDMNIIHDYDPKSFIDNVPLFIEQVLKTEHIDLFLSQLR
jgi:elongator complex protein 1